MNTRVEYKLQKRVSLEGGRRAWKHERTYPRLDDAAVAMKASRKANPGSEWRIDERIVIEKGNRGY